MPTYQNRTIKDIRWLGRTYRAGEEFESNRFIPCDITGLTKINDLPLVAPTVLFCDEVINSEIDIPYAAIFSISAVADSTAELYLGDSAIPVKLSSSIGYSSICRWEDVGKLRVVGMVAILIEKTERR